MSSLAALPSRIDALAHIKDGFYAALETVQNLTYRDRSKAASAVIEAAANVGDIEYVGPSQFLPPTDAGGPRIRQVVGVQLGGHRHQMTHTRPLIRTESDGEAGLYIPGITLDPAKPGTAQIIHDRLADLAPNSDHLSINTNGIGDYETRFTARQIWNLTFSEMADERLRIAGKVLHGKKVHALGNSMGGMLVAHTLHANLESRDIDVADVVLLKPALVTPEEAWEVLGRQFLPHELREAIRCAGGFSAFLREIIQEPPQIPRPCIGNAIQLGNGIAEKKLVAIAATGVPMSIVAGGKDKLNNPGLYARIKAVSPETVDVKIFPDQGHPVKEHATEVLGYVHRFARLGRAAVSQELVAAA